MLGSLFEDNRKVIKIAANETDITNFKRLLEINPGRGINRSDNQTVYENDNFYKSYQELNYTVSDSVYFETQGIMLQMISRFLNAYAYKSKNSDPIPSKILEAIRYIQINLKGNLKVNHLADKANLHQDYFSRLFFKHTGQRPLAYLQEKRIERAQYLIATTTLSYDEIGESMGFESLSHFSRTFKKLTTLTPTEYRKQISLLIQPYCCN